jgi:head-tail adaptor
MTYSDLTTAAGFESTGAIVFIKSNGDYYLIGGYASWTYGGGTVPRLVKFDGATFTDLTDQLIGFSGKTVLEAEWDPINEYWLIGAGGILSYTAGALNKYDGATFTDLIGAYATASGSASAGVFKSNGSYWLIATAKGPSNCLVKYDGTNFTMTSLVVGDYIISIANKGNDWLIGGCTGQLVKFDGTDFTDLEDYMIPFNPSNYADASPYGGGNFVQANDDYWLISSYKTIGESGTLYPVLVKWDGADTWTDYSSSIPYYASINLGMYKVLWDGTLWIFNLGAYVCTFSGSAFASYDILPYSPSRLCVTASSQFLSSYRQYLREDTLTDTFKRIPLDSISFEEDITKVPESYYVTLTSSSADVINISDNPINIFHTHTVSTSTKYENYITGDDREYHGTGSTWSMQTFTVSTAHTITSVKLKLYRVGSGGGTMTVSIRATSAGLPTGGDLCSGTINGGSLTTDTSGDWYEITFGEGTPLSTSQYAICVRSAGDSSNYPAWRVDTAGSYTGGTEGYSLNAGSSWTARSANDYMFEEWGTTTTYVYTKNIFESVELTASIDKVRVISKTLTDTFNIVGGFTLSVFKSISESLALTETVNKLTSRILSSAVALVSNISKSINKSITSVIELFEAFEWNTPGWYRKVLSDMVDLSDILRTLTEYHRTLNESTALDDTESKFTQRTLAESHILVDSLARIIAKVATETNLITETLSKSTQKVVDSAVSVLDTWFNQAKLTLTDSVSFIDTLGKAISKSVSNALSFAETLVKKATKTIASAFSLVATSTRSQVADERTSGISGLFIDDFTLQSNILTADSVGGHTDDYTQVTKTFRGQLSRAPGSEGPSSGKTTAYASHILYCAYMDVNERDRVIFGDRTFLVTGVKNPSNADEHLEIDLLEL